MLYALVLHGQEYTYFNNIYNPINTYASGRGILEIDNHYYGLFGTWAPPDYWYKIGVFKMDLEGNLLDWKIIGKEGHDFFAGSIGGTLIQTNDGNLAFACHVGYGSIGYGTLVKLNFNLDTIWKKNYFTENELTLTIKVKQANDGGYIIVGHVKLEQGTYYNALILRTDSQGNELWHKDYGGNWAEQATDVIETPDGGYLIGGYFWKPGYDQKLDAMVIKTDSLGNEEWTKYYGNPNVDDNMALLAMADDGNYLVATVYGNVIFAPTARSGRPCIIKVDSVGNIINVAQIGPNRLNLYLKNFRKINEGYILTGFSKETDTSTFQYFSGWTMKLNNNLDSIWYRDFLHEDENWENYLYDTYPTGDNGYISIGMTHPDLGGTTEKMWIIKVDSMGCDTPGCATGVQVFYIPAEDQQELRVWPNPTSGMFQVSGLPAAQAGSKPAYRKGRFQVAGPNIIRVYNSQGVKVEEVMVPEKVESFRVDASRYPNGLYYLQLISDDQVIDVTKFIKY